MAVVIELPFTGLWRARNSPARRVPSHGTDLLASTYAIDFIGVDSSGRSGSARDWRSFLATEPPSRFVGFDRPLLSPGDGTIVTAHDGEPDHAARRSQLTLIPYALGQAGRFRRGVSAIAGNYVIIALRDSAVCVALVHLRRGSVSVSPGDSVHRGTQLATCGNSGNSTQPHVHIQLMTSPDMAVARAVPMAFARFQERPPRASTFTPRESTIPAENALLKPSDMYATTQPPTASDRPPASGGCLRDLSASQGPCRDRRALLPTWSATALAAWVLLMPWWSGLLRRGGAAWVRYRSGGLGFCGGVALPRSASSLAAWAFRYRRGCPAYRDCAELRRLSADCAGPPPAHEFR